MFLLLGSIDISLVTRQVISLRSRLQSEVKFFLNVDEVAQESDETFSIFLSNINESLFPVNTMFVSRLNGTVRDSNRK